MERRCPRAIWTAAIFAIQLVLGAATAGASSLNEDHLWLELGKCRRERDGSLILPLEICWGRFPDVKRAVHGFDRLQAFVTRMEGLKDEARGFLRCAVEDNQLMVRSFGTNRFLVKVEAERSGENLRAQTSFILFGKSPGKDGKATPAAGREPARGLDLLIVPEVCYWLQTGQPLEVAALFDGAPLRGGTLCILDARLPPIEAPLDECGRCIYIPPHDTRLNREGETAHKQALLIVRRNKGASRFITSHTLLLHRSRYGNNNIRSGMMLFAGTFACSFMLIIGARRRFNP
jgi:hypothetical protein